MSLNIFDTLKKISYTLKKVYEFIFKSPRFPDVESLEKDDSAQVFTVTNGTILKTMKLRNCPSSRNAFS